MWKQFYDFFIETEQRKSQINTFINYLILIMCVRWRKRVCARYLEGQKHPITMEIQLLMHGSWELTGSLKEQCVFLVAEVSPLLFKNLVGATRRQVSCLVFSANSTPARVVWEGEMSFELDCRHIWGRVQPTEGSAILGKVVESYVGKRVECAMRSNPVSNTPPGLCISSSLQAPIWVPALTSFDDGLCCGTVRE